MPWFLQMVYRLSINLVHSIWRGIFERFCRQGVRDLGFGGKVNPQNPINIYRGLGVNVDLGSTSE